MTKEEEKLIEELKKELRSYFFGYDDEQTTKFADKIFGIVYPFISKSYHSGKLAGFEVCEKLVSKNKEVIIPEENPDEDKLFNTKLNLRIGYNTAIGEIKSLIKDEKKKLKKAFFEVSE